MKKAFFLLFLWAYILPTTISAKGWLDVTNQYVINPNFDNDSNTGWQGSSPGHAQAGSFAGEFWNCTFDCWQEIKDLPNGTYRISVQTFYRPGNPNQADCDAYCNGLGYINTQLYANNNEKDVVSFYSEYSTEQLPNTVAWLYNSLANAQVCYPHSMYAGVACFEQGLYWNHVECEVSDGSLRFGLRSQNTQEKPFRSEQWCLFDNWKLELWGDVVEVEDITLSQQTVELELGETIQLGVTVSPANATYRQVKWQSNHPDIVSVDKNGRITGKRKGKTLISASSVNNPHISDVCECEVTYSTPTADALIINEVMPANNGMFIDPSWNYGGFIELYNPTTKVATLEQCFISNDPTNLTLFQLPLGIGVVPAGGYRALWFDHYHGQWGPTQLDMKLDVEGGTIYISDPDGNLITSQEYPAIYSRTSYARTADGSTSWGFCSTPTPESSNNGSAFASKRLDAPSISMESQLFEHSLEVSVDIPEGCILCYTTDGSVPTESVGIKSNTGQFTVDRTTVFRFRLFGKNVLPSPIVTRSFIRRDHQYKLPIVSVATEPDNLYSSQYGIFTTGPNGRAGNGQDAKCNWNMDWDRPVNFEFFDTAGINTINQEVDMSVSGGWTRASSLKSFKLKAESQYETDKFFRTSLFPTKPYNRNKTILLRNGGNDGGCRIKDAALQEIVSRTGLNLDCQAYVPVHHFINGEYKGVINMREPNNKHFVLANYGYDSSEIDQFEISPDSGYVQMTGTKEAFDRWYQLAQDAANPDTYAEICRMVDIEEFINYIAVEFYLGNWDWPKNNLKGYRPRTEDGRFRMVTFDLDGAFSVGDPFTTFEGKRIFTFDMLRGDRQGEYITAELEIITIFLNMLANETFRKQFIDTYCLVTFSVFQPDWVREVITELAKRVDQDLSFAGNDPWSTANDLISRLNSSYQTTNIKYLRNYQRMQLSGINPIDVELHTDLKEAHIMVDDLPVPMNRFEGQLFPPVTVKAQAPGGYRFKGWQSASRILNTVIEKGDVWSYYDQGSLDGKDWTSNLYNYTIWPKGNAPLGYFTSDEDNKRGYQTILDYGNDKNNKRPTYYFRTRFTLRSTPSEDDVFTLHFTCDDGFVIYINGKEGGRYLMPSGQPHYSTYASTNAPDNPDNGTLSLKASLFKKGINYISVELHNNAGNSTDVYWDCELQTSVGSTADNTIVSTNEEYTLPSTGPLLLTALFEPDNDLTATALPVRINEVSPDNSIYVSDQWKRSDWIELYNSTSEDIDLTGMYLSDDPDQPFAFQITTVKGVDNTLPAHGYRVVWCDKLEPIQALHTTFKLDNDGGYVILTSEDKIQRDVFEYCACDGKNTVGLFPDGSADTYVMHYPTISARNVLSSADSIHVQQTLPDAIHEITADNLKETDCNDDLYDLFGRRVTQPQIGSIYILHGHKILYQKDEETTWMK